MMLTIKLKLIILISVLIGLISAFIFIYFPIQYENTEIRSVKEKAEIINKMMAYSLSPAIFFNDNAAIEEVIAGAQQNKEILFIVIHDKSGNPIFKTYKNAAYLTGYSDISNEVFNNLKRVYRTKELIYHNEEKIGALYVGYSVISIYEEIKKTRFIIAGISLLIFFCGAFAIYFISNYSLKSLSDIIWTAKEVSFGNRNIRAKVTKDETGNLAQTFNLMLDKLDHSRRNLEVIVQERTEDLKKEIEKQKETEKQLIKARDEAEEMNRLKTNFLTNMSHELRTPLNGILGFSEFLRDGNEDEEIKDLTTKIHLSGRRLLNTLNSILDLASIESKTLKVALKEIDLVKETVDTLTLLEPLAKNKNIYVNLVKSSNRINAVIDPHLYYQILNNLVGNAIKFTNKGGVTVVLDENSENGKEFVLVKVKDTGIGIPEKYHSLIFQEFRQVSEGLSRRYEGTGLGLTITKNFVSLMNGRINLQSIPGEGTTFTLTFTKTNDQ